MHLSHRLSSISCAVEERPPGLVPDNLTAAPGRRAARASRLDDSPVPATPSSSGTVTSIGGEYLKSPFVISVRGILTRPARVSLLQSLWGDAQLLRVTASLSERSARLPKANFQNT